MIRKFYRWLQLELGLERPVIHPHQTRAADLDAGYIYCPYVPIMMVSVNIKVERNGLFKKIFRMVANKIRFKK